MDMWLSDKVPDAAVQLHGLTAFRGDRNAALCGKTRRGGLCVYINAEWCKNSVLVYSYCSSLVEFVTVRCRPFCLPREFTTVFIVGVYIPPSANAKEALCELYGAISELQNAHPDILFIIAGDLNKFHQHVDFATRGVNALVLVYTNISGAYRAEPRPHLGYTDHISDVQKPWMTAKVHALLKSRDSAFRAGDKDAIRTARAKLSRAIREAKRTHSQRIHGHFQSSGDTRRMRQGIQSTTNYRPAPPACDSDASRPDALSSFYDQFEAQNDVTVRKSIPPLED
ncbi:hypothetical protein QTP86_009591 [Hemibagrus guttatus]|nr:hypothetical protein QTP86_009591 [Hemibagrus guttatus]